MVTPELHPIQKVVDVLGNDLMFPVQASAVFLWAPDPVLQKLQRGNWCFFAFFSGGARLMFAWDAETARIDELAADIRCAGIDAPGPEPFG